MVKHYLIKEERYRGWCDSPLTEKGIEQAQKAGELLKDIHFDHCYSSTSERCCDTLELVTHQPYQRLRELKKDILVCLKVKVKI